MVNPFLLAYFGSAGLAALLTPVVIRLARRAGAVDRPGLRAVHERPVPRTGGVAIFLSATGVIASALFLSRAVDEEFRGMQRPLMTLLGAATFIFLVGLADDLKGLPARCKLVAELAAAVSLCLVGVRIDGVEIAPGLVVHLGGWGWCLTLLWVVGITNAVNLSDGLDGLAAGVCTITCGVIAVLALRSGDAVLALLMLALAGSLSGFLFFNFHPARVFMGDCGSLFLGFTIAAASVMCVAKSAALVGLTLPALALGIPVCDTLFAMLRRFLERRSIFAPDRGHFHHRLLDLGLRQHQAVLLIYLVTLLAAGLGLFMLVREDVGALVVFGCVLLLIVLLFRAVGSIYVGQTLARLQAKHAHARQERRERETFERLQLRFRQVRTAHDRWQALCEAAQQLELAWICVRVTHAEGGMDTSIWRRSTIPTGFDRLMTMNLPVKNGPAGRTVEVEIAVLVDGSLESASHRAGLFSRLLDETAEPHCLSPAEGSPKTSDERGSGRRAAVPTGLHALGQGEVGATGLSHQPGRPDGRR
jgi:UDP-GlcNAc:undecaprenyl-phosphate GlcNAc-1-phosphate transferase